MIIGLPARIVGVKLTLEHIMEHEQTLYPEKERYNMRAVRLNGLLGKDTIKEIPLDSYKIT